MISRAGLAVDLSFDHKPEDEIELKRIISAGGFLTGKIFISTCRATYIMAPCSYYLKSSHWYNRQIESKRGIH